ncbi:hypothetical protein QL285_054964 [Trifolium repens]|nr:hypothetical protein QL285_054964 [Trifolium repens]
MEDGQCFKLEQRSTVERHANLSSIMEEMPQANARLNKRCLGGNPSGLTKKHHGTITDKGMIQEIEIDLHAFDPLPRVREIITSYGWLPFNNMLGDINTTIVEEFYANALAFGTGDYRSFVRGVYVSFSPDTIDSIFGFRPEDYCGVHMRRASWRDGAITDAKYDQMWEALAMPGKDWRYSRQGPRQRIHATEMLPLAKLWSRWWIHNFEACSNQTEIITTRCLAIYNILRGEPIQVGQMIAQSIKRMISSSDTSVSHPFVISHLCSLAGVPEEDDDHITGPLEPLGARYSPHMMDAVQGYRAQHPLPSYRQQYPEPQDLTGHFTRQTQNLLQHQQQVQDIWDQASVDELAAELDHELPSDDEGGQ